jgi:uncharacterized protein (DUF1697 family)
MSDRYFAFLRAVNVGRRRLTNDELLAPFVELGFADVAAYQAAGNVTFRSGHDVDEPRIEAALAVSYGFETPTFVRSEAEIAAIAAVAPFPAEMVERTAGRVQVTFLRGEPTRDQAERLTELAPAEEGVHVLGREWYWLPVAGVSGSTLPVGEIERLFGVMTMRSLGTVERMHRRFTG